MPSLPYLCQLPTVGGKEQGQVGEHAVGTLHSLPEIFKNSEIQVLYNMGEFGALLKSCCSNSVLQ